MATDISGKKVVLYADDDADDIQFVADAFKRYSKDVELVTVSDGMQALSFLTAIEPKDPPPCLIILDINMPKLNGKEALIQIRQIKRFRHIPAILFTTSSQSRDKEFADKYNAGFLTKPIDFSQVDVAVYTFMRHCTDEISKNDNTAF
jgi:CheY-like chemotaxis protein